MITKRPKNKRFPVTVLAVIAVFWLDACSQIPELDEAVPNWVRRADYPELTALDPSLATKILPQDETDKIEREMTGRRDTLERKAKLLKKPVVDDAAQTRMSNGITR